MKETLLINEMFGSVQGESTHAGRLCYFIRLAGCNLRCTYCDTDYSLKPTDGKEMEIDSIVKSVVDSGFKLVEVTGGEPLTQKNTALLCQKLINAGCEVLIETNGSIDISVLPEDVVRIVDFKTPTSGVSEQMLPENFRCLKVEDEVKFVIGGREDYEFALSMIEKHKIAEQTNNILFSPMWDKIELSDMVDWMTKDLPPARMQVQMHKFIWDPAVRGV